jgi:hypothetical protein
MTDQESQSRSGEFGQDAPADSTRLLIDRYLPRYDFVTAHARILRAPPEQCYRAVREVDLFRDPIIRALLTLRSLPLQLANRLSRRARTPVSAAQLTFRLDDMLALGWMLLAEDPGVELVFGQVSRPWKSVAASGEPPASPATFSDFATAGFAKIVFGLRVTRYGASSSILTMETRVALTDSGSRRRFRRYWMVIGPFSDLVRRMALRLVAAELDLATAGRWPRSWAV